MGGEDAPAGRRRGVTMLGASFAAAPALLQRQILAAADVHLTAGHDLGSVWSNPHGP
jgi:hypothetical protein